MKIGIVLTPDERSKAYIQKLLKNEIFLDDIIFMNDNKPEKQYLQEMINKSIECGFDISIPVKTILENSNLNYQEFNFVDINNTKLIEYLSKIDIDVIIFTGGGILRNEILGCGPKFLHFHPGIVPDFRGSTCFYYSILKDDQCGVTSYFMDEKLDAGDIVFQKYFKKPNHVFVDEIYDAYIRSETMIEVLQKKLLEKNKIKKQDPSVGETFFIIHPVLKHIAILSCTKNN